MPGYETLEFDVWFEVAAVLAVGVAVIVGLAALSDRVTGAAVRRLERALDLEKLQFRGASSPKGRSITISTRTASAPWPFASCRG